MSWMLLDVIGLSNVGTGGGNTIIYENGLSPVDSVIFQYEDPQLSAELDPNPLIVVFEEPEEFILILADPPEE